MIRAARNYYAARFVFVLTRESSCAYMVNTYEQTRCLPAAQITLKHVFWGAEFS